MFIARFLDQKQGETKVIDQQQVLKDVLDQWLKTRPSASDLAERGIIGRGPRFAYAQEAIDEFLRARARAKEEEANRVPAGSVQYSQRVQDLLRSDSADGDCKADASDDAIAQSLRAKLNLVQVQRNEAMRQLETASSVWSMAAQECRDAIVDCDSLSRSAEGVSLALKLVEANQALASSSLAEVFSELSALQKLTARRHCLHGIVKMVEQTDAVQVAVEKCMDADGLPLKSLEQLPALCADLPWRSRGVGVKRVLTLIASMRMKVAQTLSRKLRSTGQWPPESHSVSAPAPACDPKAASESVELCVAMQRLQKVDLQVRKLGPEEASADDTAKAAEATLWAARVLAMPLAARFRHHFCRVESQLCRMDKPEWAFKYLLDLLSDHTERLELWLETATKEGNADASMLQHLEDLPSSLALALAVEAQLFLRSRIPALAHPDHRTDLLHTLQHVVRFHADLGSVGGPTAAAIALADFNENRPLSGEEPAKPGTDGHKPLTEEQPEERAPAGGGLVAVQLIEGISRTVRPVAAHGSALIAGQDVTHEQPKQVGFLDLWASADAEFIQEKITASTGPDGGAWGRRPLAFGRGIQPQISTEGAVAAELATVIVGLFERARERAECLEPGDARQTYCARVLESGLAIARDAVKGRWNALDDPLEEPDQAALALETLEEICNFLDGFHLAVHLSTGMDEVNILRLGMLEKLSASMVQRVHAARRRLHSKAYVLSAALAAPVLAFSRRLRESNFESMVRRVIAGVAEVTIGQLIQRIPFGTDAEVEVFVGNCRDDLSAVFAPVVSEEDLLPFQPLWDGCTLLTLPKQVATDTLAELLRISKCAPVAALQASPLDAAGLQSGAESHVVQREQAELFARIGLQDLPVADAITVLRRRPDLAGSLPDMQESSLNMLEDLLPLRATATAQATLQLGAKALQQFHSPLNLQVSDNYIGGLSRGLIAKMRGRADA